MCVIFYKSSEMPDWKEIFRTETIDNNLNPNFVKKVTHPAPISDTARIHKFPAIFETLLYLMLILFVYPFLTLLLKIVCNYTRNLRQLSQRNK